MVILSAISAYSTASTSEAAYIIGGYGTEGNIAEFRNYSWSLVGTLVRSRYEHGSIALDNDIMVIGGYAGGSYE